MSVTPAPCREVEDFLAYQGLIHVIAGTVIRRELTRRDGAFALALPERDDRIPAGACGITGPDDTLLVLTADEWGRRLERAQEHAETWMTIMALAADRPP